MLEYGSMNPTPIRSPLTPGGCSLGDVLTDLHQAGGVTPWADRFGELMQRSLRWPTEQLRILSLFSGGGGLDIAFHDAGFDVVEMVELNATYCATLHHNAAAGGMLAGAKVHFGDIREYDAAHLRDIAFIIGGPPCQTFSAAGRRMAGAPGAKDPRGELFAPYVRLLEQLRPKGFLFENVPGIKSADGGMTWPRILEEFDRAGYDVFERVLDAADYGVPQHRERLFVVGVRKGAGAFAFPRPTHGPDATTGLEHVPAGKAVEGADLTGVSEGIGGLYGPLLADIPPGLNYSFYTARLGDPRPLFAWRSKFSDFLYKADPKRPVRTLKASDGGYTGPFSWQNRVFTTGELKRLQTFPDGYEFHGTYKATVEQIGNAVPPQLGRVLALAILDQVFAKPLPWTVPTLEVGEKLSFTRLKRSRQAEYQAKARAVHAARGLAPLAPGAQSVSRIRRLRESFEWTEHKTGSTVYRIEADLGEKEWRISAGTRPEGHAYDLELLPHEERGWHIPLKRVVLVGRDSRVQTHTALWLAFEEFLREVYGKYDLVQLSDYYYYPSRIWASFAFPGRRPAGLVWRALEAVVEGRGVGERLTTDQLAKAWGVKQLEVLPALQSLRELGYEVRGASTNLQMTSGEYLVPYVFPTLRAKSLQRHRRLHEVEVAEDPAGLPAAAD